MDIFTVLRYDARWEVFCQKLRDDARATPSPLRSFDENVVRDISGGGETAASLDQGDRQSYLAVEALNRYEVGIYSRALYSHARLDNMHPPI